MSMVILLVHTYMALYTNTMYINVDLCRYQKNDHGQVRIAGSSTAVFIIQAQYRYKYNSDNKTLLNNAEQSINNGHINHSNSNDLIDSLRMIVQVHTA